MANRVCFAVHNFVALDDASAECMADDLMAQTHAQQRDSETRGFKRQFRANPRFFGTAWTGRNDDRIRLHRNNVADCKRIVPMNRDVSIQFAQILGQIECEAVVIIDQNKHFVAVSRVFRH